MAKYGSPSAKIFLVDGFDLRGVTTELGPIGKDSMLEQCDVVGDDWRAYAATGIRSGSFGQKGFYDDAADSIHDAISGLQGIPRVVCVGISGNVAGGNFVGFEGAFASKYNRVASRGALHKANAEYSVSGQVDEAIIL